MSESIQELIVSGIVGLAVLYLGHRITGFPRFGRKAEPPSAPVQLGPRLQRGLAKSNCH